MSKKVTKPSKSMRIFCIVSGILLIVLGLLLTIAFPIPGILAVAYGIFSIYRSKKFKSVPQTEEPAKKTDQTTVTPPAKQLGKGKTVADETIEVATDLLAEQTDVPKTTSIPVQMPVAQPATPNEKTERHRIAGTSYRIDAIKSLGVRNPDYDLTKMELVEDYLTDKSIYEYEFPLFHAELIEEPDNEFDPNAIKVVLNGIHVGYIKAGSCARVKKRIREDRINYATANIFGGRYKYVSTDYDDDGNEQYTLDKGEKSFTVILTLHLKD